MPDEMLQHRLVCSGMSPTLGSSWQFNLGQVRSKIVLLRSRVRIHNLSSLSSRRPSMAAGTLSCKKLASEMQNYGLGYLAGELATSGPASIGRVEGGEVCGGGMAHVERLENEWKARWGVRCFCTLVAGSWHSNPIRTVIYSSCAWAWTMGIRKT